MPLRHRAVGARNRLRCRPRQRSLRPCHEIVRGLLKAERRRIQHRTRAAILALATAGRWLGGRPNYGYRVIDTSLPHPNRSRPQRVPVCARSNPIPTPHPSYGESSRCSTKRRLPGHRPQARSRGHSQSGRDRSCPPSALSGGVGWIRHPSDPHQPTLSRLADRRMTTSPRRTCQCSRPGSRHDLSAAPADAGRVALVRAGLLARPCSRGFVRASEPSHHQHGRVCKTPTSW